MKIENKHLQRRAENFQHESSLLIDELLSEIMELEKELGSKNERIEFLEEQINDWEEKYYQLVSLKP